MPFWKFYLLSDSSGKSWRHCKRQIKGGGGKTGLLSQSFLIAIPVNLYLHGSDPNPKTTW